MIHRTSSSMGVCCGILAFAFLLLCPPSFATEDGSPLQSDEDLTFIDAEDYAKLSSLPSGHQEGQKRISKRQSLGDYDSEDIGEGSGDVTIRTYRLTYTSKSKYKGDQSLQSPRFYQIQNGLQKIFGSLDGEVDIYITGVRPGSSNREVIQIDLIHIGAMEERREIEDALRQALADDSYGLNGIPESLVLREVQDRTQDSCSVDEIPCREGGCVPLCDGVAHCNGGEDEDESNCPSTYSGTEIEIPPEVEINSVDNTVVTVDKCPGDDKFYCQAFNNTVVVICSVQQCDNQIDCPLQEDEDREICVEVECGQQEFKCDNKCLSADELCDGKKDCLDGEDEALPLCAEPKPQCNADQFTCHVDGSCIEFFRRCDLIQDCTDNEDELNCPCEPPNYQCNSGKCIKEDMRCNGKVDCDDGSDEDIGCPGTCPEGQFRCDDGECISIDYKCNYQFDCADHSDEQDCSCKNWEWKCGDGSCIDKASRCDKVFNCADHTDEEDCDIQDCGNNEWKCENDMCISIKERCDGFIQCADRSDEFNCSEYTCGINMFKCNDGICIPKSLQCDGHPYCRDKSDEDGCFPTLPQNVSTPMPLPPTLPCEPPKHFLCSTGVCIDAYLKCDGIFHCPDRDDELNCPSCSIDEFTCENKKCVKIDKICDGINDCIDKSDEMNCTSNACQMDEFECNDGTCLSISKRCNGQRDCRNGEDEKSCSCSDSDFKCPDDQCIPQNNICDGIDDCYDGSDEKDCQNQPDGCPISHFACNTGGCVEASQRCDGRVQCVDGSDERGCPPASRPCTEKEFRCLSNDSCIDKHWRCDSTPDCIDGSDEMGCECHKNEFDCGHGICIPESLQCDGTSDCSDGADEANCGCLFDEFECGDGLCISKSRICDGKPDCQYGNDEINCPTTCASYQFQCASGDQCIYATQQCNGNRECADGSDELYCPDKPEQAFEVSTPRPAIENCPSYLYQCTSGQCIDKSLRCDGQYDCRDESDEHFCPAQICVHGEFSCDSGECIPQSQVCDREFHCGDASDELNCPTPNPGPMACSTYEFECRSGECISDSVICDGRGDCFDNSDEANCPEKPARCDDREFACGDGTCISIFAECDGYFDCRDGSDETECQPGCHSDEYTCDNRQCISRLVVCDGRMDCLDGSEERDCPRPCNNYEFSCYDGVCIPSSYKCDGKPDCADQSDEYNCPTPPPPKPSCSSYDFQCSNGKCIPISSKCDGKQDCLDRSDEINCPPVHPPYCHPTEFACRNGECIHSQKHCDQRYDCLDRSDEENCPIDPTPPTSGSGAINLQVSPPEQTIEESRQVVFRCRDTSDLRKPVHWVRQGNLPLPPTSTDIRGRLTLDNVQIQHSGIYFCEAQGVPENAIGRKKAVTLTVIPFERPTLAPIQPVCNFTQATCMSGQCIPRSAICDGVIDCSDGSDEIRCDPLGCEPNEFQCDNHQCVQISWLCDSDDDCGDKSDEKNCDPPIEGERCRSDEFACKENGSEQCIPKAFHCDNEVDCEDGSDEFGCSKPIIIQPPPRTITVEIRSTFIITCKAVGVPTPIIVWRLNWGHIPLNCSTQSVEGYGTLTCSNAQPSNQGAYSCEALNSLGSVFAEPDAILYVNSTESICLNNQFNAGAVTQVDCLDCFCFSVSQSCYSTEMHISQVPPPDSSLFHIIGVNQGLHNGNFVIRERDYPLHSTGLRSLPNRDGIMLSVRDRSQLGGPSDLLIYFSLPETHTGSKLKSYGGHLQYTINFNHSDIGERPLGPDIIIRGNNITLMHVHEGELVPGYNNLITVRFWPGNWFKEMTRRGEKIRPHNPASRRDIMMVLENMDLILIRGSYTEGTYFESVLSDIQLDTAIFKETGQGRAYSVEECACPTGYTGSSCQDCARNYRRIEEPPYLGTCVFDAVCGHNEYGDPSRGIPCMPCPCPLTSESNRFSQSCYLDTDGDVTCNCFSGYEGRRCQYCSSGYDGDPQIPGDLCRPAGICDPIGSFSLQPDPFTGNCPCKDYVTGPKCTHCQPGSFNLHSDNKYGCTHCFCMGKTDRCSSSSWYRTQEVVRFSSEPTGFQLVDQQQQNTINTNFFVDRAKQELVYQDFSHLVSGVYYWKLPRVFLGDKVTAYGGNLTFSLRYVPMPGSQSSKNNAFDVEIFGNDITMRYFSSNVVDILPNQLSTVSVPFYEQYWQRQDGEEANREHFLMALADLEHLFIKATYTTNTQEVGLKEVIMDIAEPRNTGLERAYAVESCDCPRGYKGLSCEDCDVGYTRKFVGLNLGDCVPCECNGHSTECDSGQGFCINCRNNRAGDFCESCALGYEEDGYGYCQRVDPCACDPRGSLTSQCFDNQCQCKDNVEGDQCHLCKEGHFFLSEKAEHGCLKCWCSGVTNICSSYQYRREQIPMNVFPNHGFTLTDRKRISVHTDLDINEAANELSFNKFSELPQGENYYWSLPNIFTGNRLTSYGGRITVTQRYESLSNVDLYAAEGAIIITQDQKEFIWMNPDTLKPSTEKTYTIHLHESNFTVNQSPATRGQFLAALASIEAILIRATFSETMKSTYLKYLMMDTAGDFHSNQEQALEVEHCSCPREYTGLSCEQCVKGYYRDPLNNRCRQCPCSGKEESCVASPNGVVICNCLPGFFGNNCEFSEGPTPKPLEVSIIESEYIVDVGSSAQMLCQSTSSDTNRLSFIWDREGAPLPYGRSVDNRQGILVITKVRPSDAGVYICRGSTGLQVAEARTTLNVSGGAPPSSPVVLIEESQKELHIEIGQTIRIRCRASGNPPPHLQWIRENGRPLSPWVSQNNGILTLNNVQPSDTGIYMCTGRNLVGTAEAVIAIYVEDLPQPPHPPSNYYVVELSQDDVSLSPGASVHITCRVQTIISTITYSWSRVQGILPEKAIQQDGVLTIPDAMPVDSGLYTCRATDRQSRYGEATSRIIIEERGNLPEVNIKPDRQTIYQGTNAELRCIANGQPNPSIRWEKVNEEFSRNVRIDGNILYVQNALVTDRGLYACIATNIAGEGRSAAILEVERREPPAIEMYPDTKQIIEKGSSALFQCHLIGGIPSPSITWARVDGNPMTDKIQMLPGGVIKFIEATEEEEGSYICTATNDAGKMTAIATLEIQTLPEVIITPSLPRLTVKMGEKVQLKCIAHGDPPPSVIWQKLQEHYPLSVDGKSLAPSKSLYEISSVNIQDQGTYQCTATNSAGTGIKRIQLIVEDTLPIFPPNIITTVAPVERPNHYVVGTGDAFEFRCDLQLNDAPSEEDMLVEFKTRDGHSLPPEFILGERTVKVKTVTKALEGEYACVITKQITGEVITKYFYIEVIEPPRITLEPARQVVRPGDNANIRCSVTGGQPITINWLKEYGTMPPSVAINGGLLMFRQIEVNDAGIYLCRAVNRIGTATGVAEVVVNEKPMVTALKPRVIFSEGENGEVRCETSGIDDAQIRWLRNDGNKILPRNFYPSANVLRILNADVSNAGIYECRAQTPSGGFAQDFIQVSVKTGKTIRIVSIPENIHIGDDVELICEVEGAPQAFTKWSKLGGNLPYNSIPRGRKLLMTDVRPANGGIYICAVTTQFGTFEKQFALAIQYNNPITYGHGQRSVETRSAQLGSTVVLTCKSDAQVSISYTWSKQNGQLPIRATLNNAELEIPNVQADDAGTFICTTESENETQDILTLLIVTGVIPRFTGNSYLALPTLPDAYRSFNLEVSFKPESPNGLIIYNSQKEGPGDYVSFGLKDGYAEFRFELGSGPALLVSKEKISLNEWHTAKLNRNRMEGTMTIDDNPSINGQSGGIFHGLDLIKPLYIGGIPDTRMIKDNTGISSGFKGCISKLVVHSTISEMMRSALSHHEITPCNTCNENPCENGGVCQESYSHTGHRCICPAGFSGHACESTGQSCYPGVCGPGRCVNKPGGYECYCPFGFMGHRCQHEINIVEPSFASGSFMSYPTPKALKHFSFGLNIKPKTLDDGLIMYCAQQDRGEGDFISLAMREKRLEFLFNTGTGTAILRSEKLIPEQWTKVHINRTDKSGFLKVNDEEPKIGQSPGASRGLNLRTPLFIGGVDNSKLAVALDVKVNDEFMGCISEIQIMDQPINIADSLLDSANVDQCGISPCSRKPCENGGICTDDYKSPHHYTCTCHPAYSGTRCEVNEGRCAQDLPCLNGGVCEDISSTEFYCLCPLGFSGLHCEHEYYSMESANFNEQSWIELDRYLLPQDGISEQEVTIEFTTYAPQGLLFWQGQEPDVQGHDKDYISLGLRNGFIEFIFHMGGEIVNATSTERVNDGTKHTVTFKRETNKGTLLVDEMPPQYSKGSESLFSFHTHGNIYIGGVPDLPYITGDKYKMGYTGCIHNLVIGVNSIKNYMDQAHQGVNVSPCPR